MNERPRMSASNERGERILKEINKLSDQVRKLRGKSTSSNQETQIRHAEEQLRAKWHELRALRAGAAGNEGPPARSRPRYG